MSFLLVPSLDNILSGGGDVWTPAQLSDLARIYTQDGSPYYADPINGTQVLRSLEPYGDYRQPRQGRYYVADGTDDYIAVASLTGSETVVSSGGTGTPSISAGRIDLTAGTYWDIVLSNGSHYPCNEEGGTTSYDISENAAHGTITNATLGTFHGAGATRVYNRNNEHGYKLSSGVYIPKRLGSDLAADGGALSVTGPCPYPVSTSSPCVTGDGTSYIDYGSALIPDGATEFVYEIDFYLNSTTQRLLLARRGNTTNGINITSYSDSTIYIEQWVAGGYTRQTITLATAGISATTWYRLKIDYNGSRTATDRMRLYVDGVQKTLTLLNNAPAALGTMSGNLEMLRNVVGQSEANGRLSNFSLTTGGLTTTFPLQDGIGDGTNRNIAYRRSDGTGGVIEAAIKNGTLANVWANRCNVVQDECVLYGGRLAGVNMLRYSEQFDNAAWTKTRCAVSANATLAPDGTLTADKLVEDATASQNHTMLQASTVSAGATYVQSVYVKANERSVVFFQNEAAGSGYGGAFFTLTGDGIVSNYFNGLASGGAISHVGNGWYRIRISFVANGAAGTAVLALSNAAGVQPYTGDGVSGVFVWGAQLHLGSTLLDYVRTGASTRGNEFVLGLPNSDLCADGLPKTLSAGKFGNPFSRRNLNPFSAAELNGRSIPTALAPGGSLASVTPANSAFMRSADDGDDRLVITVDELTGTNLTKMQAYVA